MNTANERKCIDAATKIPVLNKKVDEMADIVADFIHDMETALDGIRARCERMETAIKKVEAAMPNEKPEQPKKEKGKK